MSGEVPKVRIVKIYETGCDLGTIKQSSILIAAPTVKSFAVSTTSAPERTPPDLAHAERLMRRKFTQAVHNLTGRLDGLWLLRW